MTPVQANHITNPAPREALGSFKKNCAMNTKDAKEISGRSMSKDIFHFLDHAKSSSFEHIALSLKP
jgi:hypothetical protein